jgi:hypothetical protein
MTLGVVSRLAGLDLRGKVNVARPGGLMELDAITKMLYDPQVYFTHTH